VVASELVTNAVVHQGPLRLRLEWRQERLHVAVSDRLPRLLRLAAEPGELESEHQPAATPPVPTMHQES
jgi:hypothetical protein